MKRIVVDRPGGPEVMALRDAPDPTPGAGQALVRVEAAGVNFIDCYHRGGAYPLPPPIPIGLEGAGVVQAVGDGVAIAPGTRVAWTGVPGSYATHVVAPVERLVPLPDALDARTAAGVMLQGLTAHYLVEVGRLGLGDDCLVHAAAGGVGLLLCQLAKAAGARVIGTAGTEEKAALARAAGADEVIPYTQVDFASEVKRLTDGRGVSVVYDSVGKDTFDKSLECLRPRGMMVLFGQSSGPVAAFDPQRLNLRGSLFLTRPNLAHYTANRAELEARVRDVFGRVLAGTLTVRVGGTYPLANAERAHLDLERRRSTGKLLLLP